MRNWQTKSWRFVPRASYDGFMNMGLDEIMQVYAYQTNTPVIRFYDWNPPAVSIGYDQSLDGINLANCRELGLDVVKRKTGGRAVLHGYGITYSAALPRSFVGDGKFATIFEKVTVMIRDSLESLGIDAVLSGHTDIIVNKRKISGSSALYSHDTKTYLMHGEIFFELNPDIWSRIFGIYVPTIKNSVVGIKELDPSLSLNDAYEAFKANFLGGKTVEEQDFNSFELSAAAKLRPLFELHNDPKEAAQPKPFEDVKHAQDYLVSLVCGTNWGVPQTVKGRNKRYQLGQQDE